MLYGHFYRGPPNALASMVGVALALILVSIPSITFSQVPDSAPFLEEPQEIPIQPILKPSIGVPFFETFPADAPVEVPSSIPVLAEQPTAVAPTAAPMGGAPEPGTGVTCTTDGGEDRECLGPVVLHFTTSATCQGPVRYHQLYSGSKIDVATGGCSGGVRMVCKPGLEDNHGDDDEDDEDVNDYCDDDHNDDGKYWKGHSQWRRLPMISHRNSIRRHAGSFIQMNFTDTDTCASDSIYEAMFRNVRKCITTGEHTSIAFLCRAVPSDKLKIRKPGQPPRRPPPELTDMTSGPCEPGVDCPITTMRIFNSSDCSGNVDTHLPVWSNTSVASVRCYHLGPQGRVGAPNIRIQVDECHQILTVSFYATGCTGVPSMRNMTRLDICVPMLDGRSYRVVFDPQNEDDHPHPHPKAAPTQFSPESDAPDSLVPSFEVPVLESTSAESNARKRHIAEDNDDHQGENEGNDDGQLNYGHYRRRQCYFSFPNATEPASGAGSLVPALIWIFSLGLFLYFFF